jgi:hypothetical protein
MEHIDWLLDRFEDVHGHSSGPGILSECELCTVYCVSCRQRCKVYR